MAWTSHTGKDMTLTWNGNTFPGIRRITISEEGAPLPDPQDITKAGDAAYVYEDDPLGGRGSARVSITVEGQANNSDVADSGPFSETLNTSASCVIDPAGATATYNRSTTTVELVELGTPPAWRRRRPPRGQRCRHRG
jgi:hypothetical protein